MENILIVLGLALHLNLPLLAAWLLDSWLGDPAWLPHPVVAFGKAISFFEHRLNVGKTRFLKGAFTTLFLVAAIYLLTFFCCVGWEVLPGAYSSACKYSLFSTVWQVLR